MISYSEFLQKKIKTFEASGFDVKSLHNGLFDFQSHIVKVALKKGRYAIFADCGLGKTFMQIEFANQVIKKTGKPVLILCPLAVAGQTIKEGLKFGIEINKAISNPNEVSIEIANYEQIENLQWSKYSGVVLDESSILKNYEGAYRSLIISAFALTPYKLACTATPAPNDPMELGNHSEFLGIMSRAEMLAMYFVHDGGETAKWRVKGHAVCKFYDWVSQWAIMLTKPEDIGFKATGYNLPELNYIERQIKTNQREGSLFNDVAISATNFNQELRLTRIERLSQVAEIVNGSTDNFIIWVKQNEEADELKKLIPNAIEVRGNDTPEYKEMMLLGFAENKFRVLITKTKIAQFGLNYQNCHNQIFASLDFSFEGLYQAIRRSYRFGQQHQVNIYLITTDTMQNVVTSLKRKQKQFEEMQLQMSKSIHHEG